jgi:hypothetical protein
MEFIAGNLSSINEAGVSENVSRRCGRSDNRNRTVAVPWGEVRPFGGRGVGEMMSRVNVALGQKHMKDDWRNGRFTPESRH